MEPSDITLLSNSLLQTPLQGRRLQGRTLGEQFERHACLLVFLRHLG